MKELIKSIEDVYEKLDQMFYSTGDYPLSSDEKHLTYNPDISFEVLEDLRNLIIDLDDQLQGSGLTQRIIGLIEDGTPIDEVFKFDEMKYTSEEISNDIEANDENLEPAHQRAAERANEIKQDLLNQAENDIRELLEDLLPRFLVSGE